MHEATEHLSAMTERCPVDVTLRATAEAVEEEEKPLGNWAGALTYAEIRMEAAVHARQAHHFKAQAQDAHAAKNFGAIPYYLEQVGFFQAKANSDGERSRDWRRGSTTSGRRRRTSGRPRRSSTGARRRTQGGRDSTSTASTSTRPPGSASSSSSSSLFFSLSRRTEGKGAGAAGAGEGAVPGAGVAECGADGEGEGLEEAGAGRGGG